MFGRFASVGFQAYNLTLRRQIVEIVTLDGIVNFGLFKKSRLTSRKQHIIVFLTVILFRINGLCR